MKDRNLVCLLFAFFFVSCSDDNQTTPNNNNNGGSGMNTGCSDGTTQITDIDGNVYNVIQIGSNCWLKENLKVSRYRNGDSIPANLSDSQWSTTTNGACSVNQSAIAIDSTLGHLYNGYTVSDSRGLCPTGWHVSTEADWLSAIDTLGGFALAGGKMKAISTSWVSPNVGATNSSGFTGMPAGGRGDSGAYFFVGSSGFWWTSTLVTVGVPGIPNWNFSIANYTTDVIQDGVLGNRYGLSVRCVRD